MVKSQAINKFKEQRDAGIMEVPPKESSRKFNECDIIGNVDRDEKGNVLV